MATVRLGRARAHEIRRQAITLWEENNPRKEFSTVFGDKILEELLPKIQQAKESLSNILDSLCKVNEQTIDSIKVVTKDTEESQTFIIPLSKARVIPYNFLNWEYGHFKVPLSFNHPVFKHCNEVSEFNNDREDQFRQYERQVESLLDNYPTLNQLLTAAPWMSKLCDPDDIAKVHEKVDRAGRRKELHQLAEDEGKELRETILTSSLLGDN